MERISRYERWQLSVLSLFEEISAMIADMEGTNPNANMDVPLALKDIGIRQGLKGYTRKSSTFYRYKADVVGLSTLIWQ